MSLRLQPPHRNGRPELEAGDWLLKPRDSGDENIELKSRQLGSIVKALQCP